MEELRADMGELKSQVIQIARNPVLAIRPMDLLPILPRPEAKAELMRDASGAFSDQEELSRPRKNTGPGPTGHRDDLDHREKAVGERFPLRPPPGNGTLEHLDLSTHMIESVKHHSNYHPHINPLKLDFPPFDGENPKAWQLKCENYFRICSIRLEFHISMATMHFVGGALMWLHATKAHARFEEWETL